MPTDLSGQLPAQVWNGKRLIGGGPVQVNAIGKLAVNSQAGIYFTPPRRNSAKPVPITMVATAQVLGRLAILPSLRASSIFTDAKSVRSAVMSDAFGICESCPLISDSTTSIDDSYASTCSKRFSKRPTRSLSIGSSGPSPPPVGGRSPGNDITLLTGMVLTIFRGECTFQDCLGKLFEVTAIGADDGYQRLLHVDPRLGLIRTRNRNSTKCGSYSRIRLLEQRKIALFADTAGKLRNQLLEATGQ